MRPTDACAVCGTRTIFLSRSRLCPGCVAEAEAVTPPLPGARELAQPPAGLPPEVIEQVEFCPPESDGA